MAPKKHYGIKDFLQHAEKNLGDEFSTIADTTRYGFEEKVFFVENERAQQVDMVRIGHYYHRSGGQTIWAHSTGNSISYYRGDSSEVTLLVDKYEKSRIYYDPPFSTMVGPEETSQTRTVVHRTRQRQRFVVETMVDFAYLLTGRLERVKRRIDTDMLSNLSVACDNTKIYKDSEESSVYLADKQAHDVVTQQVSLKRQLKAIEPSVQSHQVGSRTTQTHYLPTSTAITDQSLLCMQPNGSIADLSARAHFLVNLSRLHRLFDIKNKTLILSYRSISQIMKPSSRPTTSRSSRSCRQNSMHKK